MNNNMESTIERYIDEHTDDVSPLLDRLTRETEAKTGVSRWSIGKIEGKFLQLLVKISGARQVLEIGTFTGYSALMIAEALPEDGRVTTCEINESYAEIARRYFHQSPHGRKIRLELNPALTTMGNFSEESVDFVFIDADKTGYGRYYDEGLRILRKGGLIFIDNVFWRKKIFSQKFKNKNARAIAELNAKIKSDLRVEKVMLPVRDGVYLIRKR
jgi:caffeoyl-CoA O-methyltransferase